MSAVNGVFHYRDERPADLALLERQALAMRHRGPDDGGLWHAGPVALAHRRLATVDRTPTGHQPLANEDETLWVVCDGALAGWPETRTRLAELGHAFRGTSDAEALLHLYEEHGDWMLERLRGVFAFALFDRTRHRLLVARDRLGARPLYWHDDGRRLAFASELKTLLLDPAVPRVVDERSIGDVLVRGRVSSPRTIWQGVRKLPPGHRIVCDHEGVRVERWWSLPASADRTRDPRQGVRELRERLAEAVRQQSVADVPVGALLGGGLGSSAVAALLARASSGTLRTFSVGFAGAGEGGLEHARAVARHLRADHHELVLAGDARAVLPSLVWECDEPFGDPELIPGAALAAFARKDASVVLAGDGASEVFGSPVAGAARPPAPLRALARLAARLLPAGSGTGRALRRVPMGVLERHLDDQTGFGPRELARLAGPVLRPRLGGHEPFAAETAAFDRAATALDASRARLVVATLGALADGPLTRVDRGAMLHSLEVRTPLLDPEVVELVTTIPARDGATLLGEAVRDLLPPEALTPARRRDALPVPRVLGPGFVALAREVLRDPRTRARGWFTPRALEPLLSERRLRSERVARQAFTLVMLELWAQTYLDRPREASATPLATLRGAAAA